MPTRRQVRQQELPKSSSSSSSLSSSSSSLFQHPDAIHSLKKDQLVNLCKRHGLPSSGKKSELITRLQSFATQHLDKENPTNGNFIVLRSTSQKNLEEESNSEDEHPSTSAGSSSDFFTRNNAEHEQESQNAEEIQVEVPVRRGGKRLQGHTSSSPSRALDKETSLPGMDLDQEGGRATSDLEEMGIREEQEDTRESEGEKESNHLKEAGLQEDSQVSSRTLDSVSENGVPRQESGSGRDLATPEKHSASPICFDTPNLYPSLDKFQPQEVAKEFSGGLQESEDKEMEGIEGEAVENQNEVLSSLEQTPPSRMVGSFPEEDLEESYSFISHPNPATASIIPNRSSSLEEFGVNTELSKSKSNSSISSLASSLTSSLKKKASKLFGGSMSRKRDIDQVEMEDEVTPGDSNDKSQILLDGLPWQPASPNAAKFARESLNADAPDSPQPIRIIKPRPSRARGSTSASASPAKPVSSMDPSPLSSSSTIPVSSVSSVSSISAPSSATAAVLAEMNARLAASGLATSALQASTSGLTWNKPLASQAPRFQLPSSNSLVSFNKAHEKQFNKLEGIDQHYAAKRNVSSSSSIKPETKRIKTDSKPAVSSQQVSEIERRKRERALNAARRKSGNPMNEKAKAKVRAGKSTASSSSATGASSEATTKLSRFTNAFRNVFDFNSQISAPSTSGKPKESSSASPSSATVVRPPGALSGSVTSAPMSRPRSPKHSSSGSINSKASGSLSSKPSSLASSRSNLSIGPASGTGSTINSSQREKPKFDLQASLKKGPTSYRPYTAKEALEGLKAENARLNSTSRPTLAHSPTKIPSPVKNIASKSHSTVKFPAVPAAPESSKILSPASRRPRIDHNRLLNKKREAQALSLAQLQSAIQAKEGEVRGSSNEATPLNSFSTLTSPTSAKKTMPASRLKTGKVRSSTSASAHKGGRQSVAAGVRKNRAVD